MPRVPSTRAPRSALVAAIVVLPVLAGCVSNTPSGGTSAIDVESSATECKLASTTAPSGTLTFKVKNTGDDVTEFYLLGEDELRVVSEVENVGPGLTRDLVVQVPAGHLPHGVQAGHGRRGDQGRVHRHRLGRIDRPVG